MVYSIALTNCNAGEIAATDESSKIDVDHAVRDYDGGQAGAIVKSVNTNGGHATVRGDHTVFAS